MNRVVQALLALAALPRAQPEPVGIDPGYKRRRDVRPIYFDGAANAMPLAELDAWARRRRRARQTHPGKRYR